MSKSLNERIAEAKARISAGIEIREECSDEVDRLQAVIALIEMRRNRVKAGLMDAYNDFRNLVAETYKAKSGKVPPFCFICGEPVDDIHNVTCDKPTCIEEYIEMYSRFA